MEPDPILTAWRRVVAGDDAERRLWLQFVDDRGRPVGPPACVADVPDTPHALDPGDLAELCREILDGPGSAAGVAWLITRPGRAPWDPADRAWVRWLRSASGVLGEACRSIHRSRAGLPPERILERVS